METSFRPAPGHIVAGQFRLERKLGEGGMGELYLAQQLEVERPVVLKFVHAQLASERPESVARLRREAQAIAQINHPNVVQLYTFGREGDQAFLVMEYVEGRTLAAELAYGAMDEARVLQIATQIAAGLSAAHQRGVIHRDLKPENVMLTSSGHELQERIKLVDFGIAKLLESDEGKLTRTGLVIGTPKYMAPEQIQQHHVDERTDLYCFGLIVYELLAGNAPFAGNTPYELLTQHVTAQVVPLRTLAPQVSRELEAVVLKCLEKDPAQRYANAEALLRALALVPQASASATAPLPRPRPEPEPDTALPSARVPSPPAPTPPPSAPPHPASIPHVRRWSAHLLALGALVFGVTQLLRAKPWQALGKLLPADAAPDAAPAPPEAAGGGLTNALPNALQAVSQAVSNSARSVLTLGSAEERQLGAAADCLNRDADRGYDSFYRYDSWVDLTRGPDARGHVYGVYTIYADHCAPGRASGPDAELARRYEAFSAADHELDTLTQKAERYYEQEDYKDDAMRGGQSMHAPLLAAYRGFGESERALRALVATQREARDRALLAELSPDSSEHKFQRLRLSLRALLALGVRAPSEMSQLPAESLRQALDDFEQALSAFEASAADAEVARRARALQESAKKYLRRLHKPGWSHGDRMNLDDRLAGWMVDGSPYQLLKQAEALVEVINRSSLMGGIVELEPVLPYAP